MKAFIRKYWFWFSILFTLAMTIAWQGSGSLLGGILACAITSYICVWVVKKMLPDRYSDLFCKESAMKGIRYALPLLGGSALLLFLSATRSDMSVLNADPLVVVGVLTTYPIVAAAEVFLICGPLLHLMMNRYANDDVGVFKAVAYTGIVFGLVNFAYGCTYMISIEGATAIAAIAQGIYVAAGAMFLATLYLVSENFYLVLVVRIVCALLERGVEMVSAAPVNLYTMVGLTKTDCIIVFVLSAVLFGLALTFSTNVVPWDKGDFVQKKKTEPMVARDPRLNMPKIKRKK